MRYLLLALGLLALIIYCFVTDTNVYPKGKSFYWPAMVLIGMAASWFVYQYFDRSPQYIVDENGIYAKRRKRTILWKELRYFKSEVINQRNGTQRRMLLLDKNGKCIFNVDLTGADTSIEKLEHILSKKLVRYK